MTLSTRLWADNSDLAAEALAHPFVCRLGDGSLAREIFAGYVAQDAFFLESFARASRPGSCSQFRHTHAARVG
jgi:thiaminase/transcriptional activator TenA